MASADRQRWESAMGNGDPFEERSRRQLRTATRIQVAKDYGGGSLALTAGSAQPRKAPGVRITEARLRHISNI